MTNDQEKGSRQTLIHGGGGIVKLVCDFSEMVLQLRIFQQTALKFIFKFLSYLITINISWANL